MVMKLQTYNVEITLHVDNTLSACSVVCLTDSGKTPNNVVKGSGSNGKDKLSLSPRNQTILDTTKKNVVKFQLCNKGRLGQNLEIFEKFSSEPMSVLN